MLDTNDYANKYMSLLNKSFKNNHSLNISTITVIGKMTDVIELSVLIEKLNTDNEIKQMLPEFSIKLSNKKMSTVSKRGKIRKTFFNQVTINYQDISKKSIKLFSNGIIHMTGITSFKEANLLSLKLVDLVRKGLGSKHELESLRIGMINSNFSYKYGLYLKILHNILQEKEVDSRYNPESYPAINIKRNGISIFVFGSGNVVITGSKTIDDIINTYEFIVDFLDSNKKVVKEYYYNNNKKITYVDGYPIRQVVSCII